MNPKMRRAVMSVDTTEAGAGPGRDVFDDPDDDTSSSADQTATDDDADDDADDADGTDELGDKGKAAIERMKAKVRDERRRRIAAEQERDRARNDDEATKAAREIEAAALAKANTRIVRAEIRAAAAAKFADVDDAVAFLAVEEFDVDDNGDVDHDAITDALEDLLRRKPHLAAQRGSTTPKPDRSQGPDGKGTTTSTAQRFANDLTRAGF